MDAEENSEQTAGDEIDDLFAFEETDEDREQTDALFPPTPPKKIESRNFSILPKREGLYPNKPVANISQRIASTPVRGTPPGQYDRPKQRKKQPANFYHPNDYYLGTDWPRLIVGALASLILLVSVAFLAMYLFDRFDTNETEPQVFVPIDPETNVINAYQCAGDNEPLVQMEIPPSALLSGKNASGTWVAFQNPSSPANQLWARATDLPYNDFANLETLSCQNLSDSEAVPEN